jgi:rare lipoprotein A (peptidoglycan hydrolase)
MFVIALSNKIRARSGPARAAAMAAAMLMLSACAPYHAQKGTLHHRERGIASWYGPGFAGRKTANGERFNPGALTAAHKTLPFGTTVRVTNLENDKSVIVRINDRGPYAGGRIIDLSRAAGKKIGLLATGTAEVTIVALGPRATEIAKEDDGGGSGGAEGGTAFGDAAKLEPKDVLLAARGRPVTRNGVEYLISQDKASGKGLPAEIEAEEIEDIEEAELAPSDDEAGAAPADEAVKPEPKKKIRQAKAAKAPAEAPAEKPYSADDDDF